jgi:type I restriction enzyme S subunit
MDECDTLEAQQDAAEQVRVRCTEAATHALQTADTPAAVRIAWHRLRDHFDALCATPDDVDAVRQTILQLAVQGKLTEQDPSDEPADQLLQRITSTMQSLDESGEIWRWKKMPEVSENEKDFALPDGWAWTRLGNLLNISSGDGLTSKEMSGGKIPVYGGNGITGYHEAHNVDRTRIVIGRVGFHCGSVHLTNGRAWVTDNAFVTTYPEQSIDQAFLIWLLKATDLQQNQSSTAQPVISGKKVYPIVVALPPLEEQQRIVATVDRLMDECDTLEAQLSRQQALGAELLDAVLHGAAHSEGQPAMQEAMTAG